MAERIVYWRAFADFSKVRREADKTRASIQKLRDDSRDLRTENEALSRSESNLGRDTTRASQQISAADSRVAQAKDRLTQTVQHHTAATRDETMAASKARVESAKTEKQRIAEKAATDKITAATQNLADARRKEDDATRALRSSQRQLQRVRKDENASVAKLAETTKRVEKARRDQASATKSVIEAENALGRAEHRLSTLQANHTLEVEKSLQAEVRARQKAAEQAAKLAERQRNDNIKNIAQWARAERTRLAQEERTTRASEKAQQREQAAITRTLSRNDTLIHSYQKLMAARDAADTAGSRATREYRPTSQIAPGITNLQNVIDRRQNSRGGLTGSETTAANALARAESQLQRARDLELSATDRANAAETRLASARAVAESAVRHAETAEQNLSRIRASHGPNSLEAAQAEEKFSGALLDSERALRDVNNARQAVRSSSNNLRDATDRVTSAETRLANAVREGERAFKTGAGGGNIFTRSLRSVENGFNKVDSVVGKAMSKLHSIRWPALAGGAYILAEALAAIVSSLFALASAVGPAIGGLAAIGPTVFALGGAFGTLRAAFSGVGSALKAYQTLQLKGADQAAKAAKKETSNADAIISAQEQLRNAREQVGITARDVAQNIADASHTAVQAQQAETDAQKNLTKARQDAKQNIIDLKNAVIDAALAERGATLDLADAKANLQSVLNDPNATRADRERAQLQVDQARQAQKEAVKSSQQAQKSSRDATTAGVKGNQDVIAAEKQLAQARYDATKAQRDYRNAIVDGARENQKALQAVTDAQRQLAKAQQGTADAANSAGYASTLYKERLAQLTPAARKFVLTLISMKHYWDDIKKAASNNLFPGLEKSLHTLPKLFPVVRNGVAGIARTLGRMAVDFTKHITTPVWIRSFRQLFKASSPILTSLGKSFYYLLDAIRAVSVAAIPMTKALGKGFEAWAKHIDKLATAPGAYQKMVKWFEKSRQTLHELGQIIKNISTGFFNMGKAAYGSGKSMLDSIQDITKKWAIWTGSFNGQNQLKKYFADVRDNMRIVDHLIGSLATGFLKMGDNKNFKPIIDGFRDIFSAIKNAIGGEGGDISKSFVGILHTIAKLIRQVSDNSSGFATFIGLVNTFLGVVSGFLDIPGVGTLLGEIFTAFAAFKALKLFGIISMVKGLGRAFGGLAGSAAAVPGAMARAEGAIVGASGAVGAAGAAGAGGRVGGIFGRFRRGGAPVSPGAAIAGVGAATGTIIAGTNNRLGLSPYTGAPLGNFQGTGAVPLIPPTTMRQRVGGYFRGAGGRSAGALTGAFLAPVVGGLVSGNSRSGSLRNNIGNAVTYGGEGASLGYLAGGPYGAAAGGILGGLYGGFKNTTYGKAGSGAVNSLFSMGGTAQLDDGSKAFARMTKNIIPAFTKAITDGGAAWRDYAAQVAAAGARTNGITAIAKKAGLTEKDVGLAVTGNRKEYKLLSSVLKENDKQWGTHYLKDLNKLIASYKKGQAAAKKFADVHGFALAEETKVGRGTDLLTGKYGKLIDKYDTAKSTSRTFDVALGNLTTSVRENGRTLDAQTSLGQNNISVIRQAAAAALAHAQAVYQQTGNLGKANKALQEDRQHLMDVARQSGLSKAQVKALADQLYGVPKNIKSKVNIDTAASKRALDQLNNIATQIASLRGTKISIPVNFTGANGRHMIITDDGHGHRTKTYIEATGGQLPTDLVDGVIPGYTPGRDPHEFVSNTGYRVRLSGGEGILTPETTRALGGAKGIAALNKRHTNRHIPSSGQSRTSTSEAHHSGGVIRGLGPGASSLAISAIEAQAGLAFPSGHGTWGSRLTSLFKQRLRGVNKYTDVRSNGLPRYQPAFAPDQPTTKMLLNWVDRVDPKNYGSLWTRQPAINKAMPNAYHRNPLAAILSYVGAPKLWTNYRKNKNAEILGNLVGNDRKDDAHDMKVFQASIRHAQDKLAKLGDETKTKVVKGTRQDLVDRVKQFIHHADTLPYVFGATGPGAYDCSGLTGEVWARLTGHPSYRRYFTTYNERPYFLPGADNSPTGYTIGVTNSGGTNHTAGRLGGLKFEARDNAEGIIVGPNATAPEAFDWVGHLNPNKIVGTADKVTSAPSGKNAAKIKTWRAALARAQAGLQRVKERSRLSSDKRHPNIKRRLATQLGEWNSDLQVVRGAVVKERGLVAALRKAMGLKGAGSNGGLFSSDMQMPLDHIAAHALKIVHPADWAHPWSGAVTAAESALADQDRSNALNKEWNTDLTKLASWGLPNLVNYLIDKGIKDGMSIARSAVADRKTATQLEASIKAGKLIDGKSTTSEEQNQILQIISKLGSGTAAHPYGLRDVAAFLNTPDYVPVNLFDKMTTQLKSLPDALTKRFKEDVGRFRKGTFYANTGGIVPGNRGENRDTQPAMLTPGEGVLNKRAMALIGEHSFNDLNNGIKPQQFNAGGIMLSPTFAQTGIGAATLNAAASGVRRTGSTAGAMPANVTIATTINNPTGENSVYSMNKNLQRQVVMGTVQKAIGQ